MKRDISSAYIASLDFDIFVTNALIEAKFKACPNMTEEERTQFEKEMLERSERIRQQRLSKTQNIKPHFLTRFIKRIIPGRKEAHYVKFNQIN